MHDAPDATGEVVTLDALSVVSNPRSSSATLRVTLRRVMLTDRLPVCAAPAATQAGASLERRRCGVAGGGPLVG
jgi:hypothetical protein